MDFRDIFRNWYEIQNGRMDIAGLRFESQSVNAQADRLNDVSFVEDKLSLALLQQGSQIFVPVPKRELTAMEMEELRSSFERASLANNPS